MSNNQKSHIRRTIGYRKQELQQGQSISTTTVSGKSNASTDLCTNNTSNPAGTNKQQANKSSEQICDICVQPVPGPERETIFAFGKCDHHVCYVCSARLRVICDQFECPICREKLDLVIFSSSKSCAFEKYDLKNRLFDEKYKIYFESQAIKDSFSKLLRYECQECSKSRPSNGARSTGKNKQNGPSGGSSDRPQAKQKLHVSGSNGQREDKRHPGSPTISNRVEDDAQGLMSTTEVVKNVFRDVTGLKNHLNLVHRLKLCDLCLTHNKLFPFEYSYYDNVALRKHVRQGEPKTSHRGHPECALCHCTFFNQDEMILHMSREHFHCHLCGRHDSNLRVYFLDYNSLRDHFKLKHFLCERDNCRHEQFTSAFDSRIDFELHTVQTHGGSTSGLSRGEMRQQRTITLESAPHRGRPMSPTRAIRHNLPANAAVVSTGPVATANTVTRQQPPESLLPLIRQMRLPQRAEFPTLGQSIRTSSSQDSPQPSSSTYSNQYPSLDSRAKSNLSSANAERSKTAPSNASGSYVRSLGGGNRATANINDMDFPPLPIQPKAKSKPTKMSRVQGAPKTDRGPLSLDQMISTSFTVSGSSRSISGNKKTGMKANTNKASKQKPLKIQIS